MKVSFVNNILAADTHELTESMLQPHLGLISLIAAIEDGGHEGAVFDPAVELHLGRLTPGQRFYEQAADAILAADPDVVGLTSLGTNFLSTLKLAARIKQRSKRLPILLGGPHASILDVKILERFPQFDVVIRHEAEQTINPVLAGLLGSGFDGIPGVTFRHGGGVVQNPGQPIVKDLDSLPIPAYDRFPFEEVGASNAHVEAGRGCPFSCTFCSTASFFGRSHRLKSPQRICEELDTLRRMYGISQFSLSHDLFTVNRKKVVRFCEEVAPRRYSWTCSARVDCVDEELLATMAEAGCTGIFFGIETGSARLQRETRKRLDLKRVWPIFDTAHELGLSFTASLITGYPQETKIDQDDSVNLLGECLKRYDSDKATLQFHVLKPEPETEIYESNKQRMRYDGLLPDFRPWLQGRSDEETILESPDIFMPLFYFEGELPRDWVVFLSSSFRELTGLKRALFPYLAGLYEGRFSDFFDELYEWSRAEADDGQASASRETILGFLRQRFPEDEYLMTQVTCLSMSSFWDN